MKLAMHNFHRFVLPPEIDFDDALDVLSQHGYSLYEMDYAAEDLYIRTYQKGTTVVEVVTDEAVDITYITFNEFNKATAKMTKEMGVIDQKAAFLLTQNTDNPQATYYLTMSSNKGFDEDTFHFLKNQLNQPNPKTRHFVITSLVYLVGLDWQDKIQQLLADALTHETDTENKIAATEILKALNKNNWNEGKA